MFLTVEATVQAGVGGNVAEVRAGLPALCQPPICSRWGNPLLGAFGWLGVALAAHRGCGEDLRTGLRVFMKYLFAINYCKKFCLNYFCYLWKRRVSGKLLEFRFCFSQATAEANVVQTTRYLLVWHSFRLAAKDRR